MYLISLWNLIFIKVHIQQGPLGVYYSSTPDYFHFFGTDFSEPPPSPAFLPMPHPFHKTEFYASGNWFLPTLGSIGPVIVLLQYPFLPAFQGVCAPTHPNPYTPKYYLSRRQWFSYCGDLCGSVSHSFFSFNSEIRIRCASQTFCCLHFLYLILQSQLWSWTNRFMYLGYRNPGFDDSSLDFIKDFNLVPFYLCIHFTIWKKY